MALRVTPITGTSFLKRTVNYSSVANFNDIINVTLGESVGTRDIIALQSDGKWDLADNTNEKDAEGLLLMSLKSGGDTDIIPGAIKILMVNSGWSGVTQGEPQWLDTAGHHTQTKPGSGVYARPIGWCIGISTLYLNGMMMGDLIP